jgi:transposase
LGRSRGGVTSKVHIAADTRCRPLSRVTTAGQRHDSLAFGPVLAGIRVTRRGRGRPRTRPDRVLADKAYSSHRIRTSLRDKGIKATIPEPSGQIKARKAKGIHGGRPPAFDAGIYKQRNTVERAINKLREVRAVGTRYDKREFVFRGTIDVATIRIWLRDPVHQHSRDTSSQAVKYRRRGAGQQVRGVRPMNPSGPKLSGRDVGRHAAAPAAQDRIAHVSIWQRGREHSAATQRLAPHVKLLRAESSFQVVLLPCPLCPVSRQSANAAFGVCDAPLHRYGSGRRVPIRHRPSPTPQPRLL